MPKRTDIRKILVVGSGPIVIGQGCEFDYSGCQAVKALRREGYRVVLVNSNPATVMTDPEMADATYIEPLTVDSVAAIIRKERPDALLPTLGGQTALNLAMKLKRSGVLDECGVEMIGADAGAIARAEDRNLFKAAMGELGLDMPRSGSAHSLAEAEAVAAGIGTWPLVIRPGFTLGGTGGGIARDETEFRDIVQRGLDASLNSEVLVEESLVGWKEFEMEVMRDRAGNAVIVCSIENLDPMGVHTGDSITVAPIQTLTDREYQAMRDDSIRVLEKIGIETGGSNVQWAVNPATGRRCIIEMNPRVSRSSALASKATGFPIAKIAALLAVGYTLDELANDITRATPACFEPALDYVVVKVPRFTFEKFPGSDRTLGTQMKSVGEAMAIGRTFRQAYLKAVRSLEAPLAGHDVASFDPWFRAQLDEIEAFRGYLATKNTKNAKGTKNAQGSGNGKSPCDACGGNSAIEPELLRQAKVFGFSDREIAAAIGSDEAAVRRMRLALGIRPEFGEVDTCAGEFEAMTPYYYSFYSMEGRKSLDAVANVQVLPLVNANCQLGNGNIGNTGNIAKVMILGGGPNRIGQGIEFDWCCCHAAFALRGRGIEVVMVNSNPETVSTDYDTSDRLYFEPLTFEDVMEIYERERCDGAIVQFGGQTPLNLAARLEEAGVRVLGTSPRDIALAEDRDFFRSLVTELGVRQPPSGIAHAVGDAVEIAAGIGYPVLVRPSFVLGGRGMAICYREERLREYVEEAVRVSEGRPILIDKFLTHATELDVDCVSDGESTAIGAILEHVEEAGCHSGDAAAVTPPVSLSPETIAEVERIAKAFAERLHVCGLMNIQLAVKDGEVWMIEVNPRASRTVPFVSKAVGWSLAGVAARCMAGERLGNVANVEMLPIANSNCQLGAGNTGNIPPSRYCAKEAVFPFAKFPGADITLTPEMKSTGEVMAFGPDAATAYYKSQIAAGSPLPRPGEGGIMLSIRDEDKAAAIPLARRLDDLGYEIWATRGTSTALWKAGIECNALYRVALGSPNALDLMRLGKVKWIVNTRDGGEMAAHDSAKIRPFAVLHGVPVTTTLAAFAEAVKGLEAANLRPTPEPMSLQDIHRRKP